LVALETVGRTACRGRTHLVNAAEGGCRHFNLGLLVGKFAPLHSGHEWLIQHAAQCCERLLILSYNNPEFDRCDPDARRRWLHTRFPGHEVVVLDANGLAQECAQRGVTPMSLPSNDSSDDVQQQFLSWLLKKVLLRAPDAFFCSEAYGPACAHRLSEDLGHSVEAVVVDLPRANRPISATRIRERPHEFRQWMSPEVRASFVRRVAVLGGESSGKTTLSAALANHFDTRWVPEYGRQLWDQQSGILSEPDLLKIAREQIRREEAELYSADRYLFCDTSPLTTAGYGGWMFDRVDAELAKLAKRAYDGVVLCSPDFPFVQDGTRWDETFRLQQHRWYREQLAEVRTPVLEVFGKLQSRVAQVAQWLSQTTPY
jgi:HTH-type transcriptional regulator, transcriptional repressor of NAD biosynthesis genes